MTTISKLRINILDISAILIHEVKRDEGDRKKSRSVRR